MTVVNGAGFVGEGCDEAGLRAALLALQWSELVGPGLLLVELLVQRQVEWVPEGQ